MRRTAPPFVGAAVALLGALVVASCSWTPDVPSPVSSAASAESSKVYAADGALITTLHAVENREAVPLAHIGKTLQHAVVAIEDRRFWQHRGVDLRAILRAAYRGTSQGRASQGGSTITQQYVKNWLLDNRRTVRRKVQEASLAYQLERHYSKAQILEGYLNTIYFGNGAYGAQAAAEVYFDTSADRLTLAQSATLAALIRSPRDYDPFRAPVAAAARRNLVLDQMAEQRWAPADAVREARAEPLGVAPHPTDQRYPAPHFVEEVKRILLADPALGSTPARRQAALYTGGLRIHTTLDLSRQRLAEDAVAKVLPRPGTDPEAAVVSLEPRTGEVRALVGGRDFFGAGSSAKFDLATQHGRPAASAFKPLVLAAALADGVSLTRTYAAPPRLRLRLTAPRSVWTVDNYEGHGGGRMNLVEATVQSVNTVYAQLIVDLGPAKAVDMARRMGVRSPLLALPSAVLGTNDVTPLDMADAYATLANRGTQVDPVLVTRVTRADGSIVSEHEHAGRRVLPTHVADSVTAVLEQVVQRGTGVQARIGRPVAGKTGTGEKSYDAWFVGYTPQLATAVWIGFPDAQRSMVPPRTRIQVTGGTWPAQIWQLYAAGALAQAPVTPFPIVAGPDGRVVLPPVAVPAVVGLPSEEATRRLASLGLQVAPRQVPNGDYPPGAVLAQSPPAGAQLAAGGEVVLDVASGQATTSVPDVLGLAADAAVAAVRSTGLDARVVTVAEPPGVGVAARRGRVWRQRPHGGDDLPVGDVVVLSVNPP